jgi:hypothetical protein
MKYLPHLLEIIVLTLAGIFIIYRTLTWRKKYEDFERYLARKRMSMNPTAYRFFLEKEIRGIMFQKERNMLRGQKPNSEFDEHHILLLRKIKELESEGNYISKKTSRFPS